MALTDKVAYIKGLVEGMKLDQDEKTGKVFTEILNVLAEMAEKLSLVHDDCEELKQYVTEIDEDLEVLEDEVYGDDDCACDCGCHGDCDCDDDCCCDDDCDCDCDCDCDDDCCCDDDCDGCVVTCPNCGVCLELEDDDDPEHLVCPNCKKEFSLDEEE